MLVRKRVGQFCLPRLAAKGQVVMLLVFSAAVAAPAAAQVASYVDESGKRVYVNAPPKATPAPAKKPAEAAPATLAAASTPKPATSSAANVANAGASHTRTTDPPPRPQPVEYKPAPGREVLERLVRETAERHNVDPQLVRAVIETESAWNPGAVSRKGAFGLMQLVPKTAERFGVTNVFDTKQNLDGGVRYLETLLQRYGNDLPLALAAYNAGEGAVDRWRGVPNYRETRQYVQKVTKSYFHPGTSAFGAGRFAPHPVRREVDAQGRVIFTNE